MRGLNVNGGTQAINTAVTVAQLQPFIAAAGATVTVAFLSSNTPFVLNGDGNFGIGVFCAD